MGIITRCMLAQLGEFVGKTLRAHFCLVKCLIFVIPPRLGLFQFDSSFFTHPILPTGPCQGRGGALFVVSIPSPETSCIRWGLLWCLSEAVGLGSNYTTNITSLLQKCTINCVCSTPFTLPCARPWFIISLK